MKLVIKIAYQLFFVFGLSFSFFLLFGLVADFRSIDKTKDGVRTFGARVVEDSDFNIFFDRTPTGVVKHGFVSDYSIDCTTGSINFAIRGYSLNYNYFTERAFKVYKPSDVCRAGGFVPDFQ
jgi:hypothetical protein